MRRRADEKSRLLLSLPLGLKRLICSSTSRGLWRMSSPIGPTKMVSMGMPMATVMAIAMAMEVSMVTRFGLNDFCTGWVVCSYTIDICSGMWAEVHVHA